MRSSTVARCACRSCARRSTSSRPTTRCGCDRSSSRSSSGCSGEAPLPATSPASIRRRCSRPAATSSPPSLERVPPSGRSSWLASRATQRTRSSMPTRSSCRSSTCRHVACGARAAPRPGRRSRRGWAGRWTSRSTRRAIVIRYLAAFGPATAADMRAWSGVTRLKPALESLRPDLLTFRDEAGRELFDVPDAPRPDPDVRAPARFLPEYDNVLIGHADRSRIIPAGRRIPLPPGNGARRGTFLVDGMFAGTWHITRDGATARLTIDPFETVSVAGPARARGRGRRAARVRGRRRRARDRRPDAKPVASP